MLPLQRRTAMRELPKFRAAAVQTAPVFLDTDATIDKACRLIAEAAENDAKLVVFPEVFVSAYPYWSWVMNPVEASPWFEKLVLSAIEVPGPEIQKVAQAAAQHEVNVDIGGTERGPDSCALIDTTLW